MLWFTTDRSYFNLEMYLFVLWVYCQSTHPSCWFVLTLISILPCRLWGLGKVLESLLSASPTSSLSPKISRRYWAIFFCCWMLQWFSMDRITGYLKEKRKKQDTLSYSGFHKLHKTLENVSWMQSATWSETDLLTWESHFKLYFHFSPPANRTAR